MCFLFRNIFCWLAFRFLFGNFKSHFDSEFPNFEYYLLVTNQLFYFRRVIDAVRVSKPKNTLEKTNSLSDRKMTGK